MTKRNKIGIFFINDIHNINHFITIAIELSKANDVSILTYPDDHSYLFKKLNELGGKDVKVEQLKTQPFRSLTDKLKKRNLPRINFWTKKNSTYIFNNFDAIIFSSVSHKHLLTAKKDNAKTKLIKVPHGFSGRDHGYYKHIKDFDFKLLYGQFDHHILKEKNLLDNYEIIGYPKLDALVGKPKTSIFNNNKKTVIYNPHFHPKTTSWYKFGIQILNYFESQDTYNLIFAPHISLFNRKGGEDVSQIPEAFFHSKKIHIDLGSENSVEMVYIKNADIYLGDVSSQVYEFIINPRPCIFINQEKINYRDNVHYRFWQCGNVIEKMSELDGALKSSEGSFETYRTIQEKMNSENCYIEDGSTASERAAKAIIKFLDHS